MSSQLNGPTPSESMSADISKLVEIALQAGSIVMEVYRTDFDVNFKNDDSPVTEADQRAEAAITEQLKTHWPGINIIAEEAVSAGDVPAHSDRFFLVDPLDGTKEFLHRRGDFTINIALIESGVPIKGVVFAPAKNRLFAGELGRGAVVATTMEHDGQFVVSQMRTGVVRSAPADGLDVVASRSHRTPETDSFCEQFPVKDFQSAGSSLKFCLLAAGEADLYPRLGRTMEWDTAAGDAVLRSAGGRVVTLDGADLTYGKRQQADDADFANPWFVALGDCTLPAAR